MVNGDEQRPTYPSGECHDPVLRGDEFGPEGSPYVDTSVAGAVWILRWFEAPYDGSLDGPRVGPVVGARPLGDSGAEERPDDGYG